MHNTTQHNTTHYYNTKRLTNIILVGISLLFFTSCQKDISDHDSSQQESTQTSVRNSNTACNNLVRNGDFELFSQVFPDPIDNCNNTIHLGGVDFWTNAVGTPDHHPHLPVGNGGCESCPTNAFAAMYTNPNAGYAEGIMTDVSLFPDSDIIYTLEASVNRAFSPNSNTLFYLTNGFIGGGPNPMSGNNYPNMNFVDHQLIDVFSGGNMDFCNPVTNVNHEFKADKEFSQLVIFPEMNAGSYVDNICISCKSANLQGIDYVQNSNQCTFEFQPNWLNPINYTSITWDFGDGNTSTDLNPTHVYGTTGNYVVSLTVLDDRGCCTTVTEEVKCEDLVGECKNYLCWEEFIGHIECVSSITYILPDGTPGEVTFPPLGYIDNYNHVRNALVTEINNLGYAIVVDQQDPDPIDPIFCGKNNYPDRGWFIDSDVIITSLGGNNQGNGTTCVSAAQDNYVFFHYNTSTDCE